MASDGREEPLDQKEEIEMWSHVHPGVQRWDDVLPQKEQHEAEDDLEINKDPSVTSCTKCTKNPRHKQFFSLQDFGVDKVDTIPDYIFSKQELVDYVLSSAGLVVKILGKFVSEGRPSSHYPFSNYLGQWYDFSGSGWVQSVSGPWVGLCRCSQCRHGNRTGEKRFWEVQIETARHVLFDSREAERCEVLLFDERLDGSGVHTLTGWELSGGSTEFDKSYPVCYMCDEDFVGRLLELCVRGDVRGRG